MAFDDDVVALPSAELAPALLSCPQSQSRVDTGFSQDGVTNEVVVVSPCAGNRVCLCASASVRPA